MKIHREDEFDGGQLIKVYKSYLKEREPEQLSLLLLHNREDLQGMVQLLPMLSYADLFDHSPLVTQAETNQYLDLENREKQELVLRLSLPSRLPLPVSFHANGCFFTAEENRALLRIPIYLEEMKHFYDNYKEYDYLPEEDIAIHRSVSSFVAKDHRRAASAKNCYMRKHSSYLPQWDVLFTPFFKQRYDSPLLFFEWKEEMKKDREALSKYASHVLYMLRLGGS